MCHSSGITFKIEVGMDESSRILGKNIKRLSQREGYSLVGLANYIGVSQPHVTQWVKGKTWPGSQNVDKIRLYFQVEFKDLFNDDANSPLPKSVKPTKEESLRVIAEDYGFRLTPLKNKRARHD